MRDGLARHNTLQPTLTGDLPRILALWLGVSASGTSLFACRSATASMFSALNAAFVTAARFGKLTTINRFNIFSRSDRHAVGGHQAMVGESPSWRQSAECLGRDASSKDLVKLQIRF